MDCQCQGREHVVCRKRKIETAKVPALCRGASATTHRIMTLGDAMASGLTVYEAGTLLKRYRDPEQWCQECGLRPYQTLPRWSNCRTHKAVLA